MVRLFLNGKLLLSASTVAVWNRHQNNASSTISGNAFCVELAAIYGLADFSSRYFQEKPVKKWRRRMKGYLFSGYLHMQKTRADKQIALKHLLANFSFDKVHFRQLIKAVLGSIALRK